MTEKAQTHALAAAHSATDAVGDLIAYARDGGTVDSALHHDLTYPLAKALFLALSASIEGGREPDDDDGQLMAALTKWIEA
jgi:hypothetical protein